MGADPSIEQILSHAPPMHQQQQHHARIRTLFRVQHRTVPTTATKHRHRRRRRRLLTLVARSVGTARTRSRSHIHGTRAPDDGLESLTHSLTVARARPCTRTHTQLTHARTHARTLQAHAFICGTRERARVLYSRVSLSLGGSHTQLRAAAFSRRRVPGAPASASTRGDGRELRRSSSRMKTKTKTGRDSARTTRTGGREGGREGGR